MGIENIFAGVIFPVIMIFVVAVVVLDWPFCCDIIGRIREMIRQKING